MKMVKSLLLGSAAGLVAVTGAQAADLPVKAKPVEYVKVCTLYGAGFYYIPGTDTCIKIGGFVRTEWNHNAAGSFNTYVAGDGARYNRATDTLVNRTRGLVSFDVRSQTEYGTLRSYIRSAWQWTTNTDSIGGSATAVYLDRAFIQFAGFTFGKTQSFFDVPDIADFTYQTEYTRNNTGGSGTPVFAYTAQFGNGLSATLSLEDYTERRANVVDLTGTSISGGQFVVGTSNTSDNHGNEVPDIVGNLRVDQAWGSAQISGALHLNQAQYYGTPSITGLPVGQAGHPDDKWGWAVGGGILLKMPWDPKDTFAVAASYAKGATAYVWNVPGSFGARSQGAALYQADGVAIGWLDDAYFGCVSPVSPATCSELQLPKAWNVNAGFQHYWTPTLRSSIWGSYSKFEANSTAVDELVCAVRTFAPGCADWSAMQIGTRTIWNPVANLDIGLEVMYTKINTAFEGGTAVTGASVSPGTITGGGGGTIGVPTSTSGGPGIVPATNTVDPIKRISDQHVWSGILRIQRNFWP